MIRRRDRHFRPVDETSIIRTASLSLERGETFVDMLKRGGIRHEDRNAITAAVAGHLNLRALRPGLTVEIATSPPAGTVYQDVIEGTASSDFLLTLETRLSGRKTPAGVPRW